MVSTGISEAKACAVEATSLTSEIGLLINPHARMVKANAATSKSLDKREIDKSPDSRVC